jgi:protoheme IX farnesyltransferase
LLKTYYQLTKPGIVYGNVLTAAAGFLLASKLHVHYVLLLATLIGTALVIAAACVFNNYIDRGIDDKMERTKKRALVMRTLPARDALIFATILGSVGFLLLGFKTNGWCLAIGAVGFGVYIVLYGMSKRRSVHGTLVGSIAGAAPVMAGYCAVTDRVDSGAIILFLSLACWQMPHFYAIAMYRFRDYKAAGLPVLPVKKSPKEAKIQIVCYIAAFTIATTMLTVFGYTGYVYLAVMLIASVSWLVVGIQGFKRSDDAVWARKMFLYSLLIIMVFSLMISIGSRLP